MGLVVFFVDHGCRVNLVCVREAVEIQELLDLFEVQLYVVVVVLAHKHVCLPTALMREASFGWLGK